MTIGEKIKQARIAKGLTQEELAEKLGYKSRSSVNKIETGGRDIPRSQIKKIADVLDVSPVSLLGFEDENPAEENQQEHRPEISDDDIKFALWGGAEGITDEMYEEVRQYAEMVKMREERKKE